MALIKLTSREDKDICVNTANILSVEWRIVNLSREKSNPTTQFSEVATVVKGKNLQVKETPDEISRLIIDSEAEILAKAVVLAKNDGIENGL